MLHHTLSRQNGGGFQVLGRPLFVDNLCGVGSVDGDPVILSASYSRSRSLRGGSREGIGMRYLRYLVYVQHVSFSFLDRIGPVYEITFEEVPILIMLVRLNSLCRFYNI